MLKEKDAQASFHDMLWDILLPKDHELVRIKKQFNFSWMDKDLKNYYSDSIQGRPPFNPVTVFLMLFLEIYDNLSDHEVEEKTSYNALYRYFVGLSLEDPVPDYSTLSVFRSRLGEEGFKKIFNRFVEELKKQNLVSHNLKIVDATHTEANARVRSRVGIIRQAQKRIVASMEKEDKLKTEDLIGSLHKTKENTYKKEEGKKEDIKLLDEEMEKLKELLALAKGKYLKSAKEKAEEIEDLLFNSQEPLTSLTDPDARIGHKSKEKSFNGYKIHTVTNESEITTTVETIPGNTNEGGDLPRLLKEEEKRDLHGRLALADGLYASANNRKEIRAQALQMIEVIPADDRKVQAENFTYDTQNNALTCSNGKRAQGPSPHPEGKLFYFSKMDCMECPLKDPCPSFSAREGRARVLISLDRELRLTHPLSPQEQKAIFKSRTIVERTYGKAKKWHGLSRTRYRGRWRVAIQAFLTFFVLNAKKALRILEGNCPLKPPGLVALGYG